MAILGLREAAKVAGVSRQTIYRKAQAGELSIVQRDDGSKGVDTAELVRVFGELHQPGDSPTTPTVQGGELEAARETIRRLEQSLSDARAAVAAAAERELWLREKIDQANRLLEHQVPPVTTGQGETEPGDKPRGWWARWFGP